jgi:hypothetical protein
LSRALTPALALDYVRELSTDVRAGAVLDAAGALLAGPPELGPPARALVAAAGAATELEVATPGGVVCAALSPSHAVVAVCGRFAIPAVVREDLRAALAALEGPAASAGSAPAAVPAGGALSPLELAAGELISACQRAFPA